MRATRFAIVLAAVAIVMSAATPVPPFDYFVSLYQTPGKAEVIVYMGNNAFEGAAPAGPTYNAYVKVTNAAGQQVCTANDVQAPPIPTGKAWGAYAFRIAYPRPISANLERNKGTTTYTMSAAINPEHYSSDKNLSNESATQTFTFPAGGTPSCANLPRPTFH
jgi:hypothetical protein